MSATLGGRNAAGTVLVVCPSRPDHRELTILTAESRCRPIFHDYASLELEEMVSPAPKHIAAGRIHEKVERIVATAVTAGVDTVVSPDDYPGSTLAAIVAQRLGLNSERNRLGMERSPRA